MTAGSTAFGSALGAMGEATSESRGEPFSSTSLELREAEDPRKIFVLDTSVILHDHLALDAFEEHDVAIPMTVLEELDRFKKGSTVLNRNAREFIRRLDAYSGDRILKEWIPLDGRGTTEPGGVAPTHGLDSAEPADTDPGPAEASIAEAGSQLAADEDATSPANDAEPIEAPAGVRGRVRVVLPPRDGRRLEMAGLASSENDHLILASALELERQMPNRRVILVSKDINLRLKARALEMRAEDYKRVQTQGLDHLYCSKTVVDVEQPALIDRLHAEGSLAVEELFDEPPAPNHFFILSSAQSSALAWHNTRIQRIERLIKPTAYGIEPRNAEQSFALHAILSMDVPLVALTGAAGTGKTLLALAGALENSRQYRKILLARPVVPLSNKDLGYLPGDISSKIDPYMQPLWDNLGFIKSQFDPTDKEHRRIDEMVEREKLQIVPLAYLRGRSLSRVLFIVDEAQNLTPHEVKTIITRAGDGTKVVLTGDIFQIDTPYLDTHSNGLSFLIERLQGQPLFAHINLEKGERSVLANLASSLL